MQSIFFTRHGESESNANHIVAGQTDVPLSPQGIEQAHEAGQWAESQGMKFDIIVSSPLIRCVDTAKIIAQTVGYPVNEILTSNLIIERGCGDYEGGSTDDYYEAPEGVAVTEHGVESVDALYERALLYMKELRESYPDKTILTVSHNGIGKMLRIVAEGRDGAEFDKTGALPNATIMRLV